MHKRKRLGNPSRILFLLLLHICVCMFLILLVSGSLLLLMPFLSFFSLLFFTTLRPVVIIILFGLFITSRTICFHRNYFSPVKSHNLYANLPSYISPWVKIFFIRSFLRRTQVCYIPFFFFFFWKRAHLALHNSVRKRTRQKKQNYDKNTPVPTKTLPIPTSEPFCAGNTLVRPRRVHTLLIWTSACSQAFVNIWNTEKLGHKHFIRILKQTLFWWSGGRGRCALSTFWWRKREVG